MKPITTIILILLIGVSTVFSADRQISGKVTTENGDPLVGVTVTVKGTTRGTVTKSGGSYVITVPENARILVFRFVGTVTKEVRIGSSDIINVTLSEDAIYTSEVVVTAIGLEREKKSLGYSIEELKSSQIEQAKTTNLVNAITGKVAGVNVTSSSGVPGSSSFITIRGISSLTGSNQPLFVIDGIPIDNSMSYSGNPDDGNNNLLFGAAQSNRAIDIAPEDIESMTVLKGPAATALYGIRAASGAIIITTKRGRVGPSAQINITAGVSYGLEQVNKLPEMQQKWAQGLNGVYQGPETMRAQSWGPNLADLRYDASIPNKFDKNGTIVSATQAPTGKQVMPYDNLDYFYGTGQTLNANFALTGGSEFGSFYLSVAENKTFEGIVPRSDFERTSFRFNGDAKIASFLKAGANLNYIKSGGTRIQQGSNVSGVMLSLLRNPNTFDISNGFGSEGAYNEEAYMFLPQRTQRTSRGETGDGRVRYDNPFWTVNMNPFSDEVNRIIGNVQLDFTLSDMFSFLSRFGGDHYTDSRRQIFAIHSNNMLPGQVALDEIASTDINWDNILSMNYTFNDDLSMKFLLGHNIYQSEGKTFYIQGDELIIPEFYHISNTVSQIVRNGYGKLRRSALYGDLTFNYMDWLYVNGALRNEWSTTLPEDNNSFLFGTANLSFVFTEAFAEVFKNTPISFGKFRANYAVVGKDAPVYSTFTPYIQGTYADGWTNGISFPFKGQVGFVKGDILGNTMLTPEITKSWEVGLGMNFLNDRVGFDFTYYNSTGYDQIFSVPINVSTGYWRQVMNAGQISNKGFELLFNMTPVLEKDFRWDLMLNFAKNTNNVDKLAEGVDNLFLGGFVSASVRAVAGLPYGSIFGGGFLRDDNGNLVIDDQEFFEEDGEQIPNPNYGYPIITGEEYSFGTYLPDWTMGITNSFKIFGFNLSFLLDIRQGGVMWNGTRGAMVTFGTAKETEDRGSDKVFVGVKQSDGSQNNIIVNPDQNWYLGNGGGFSGNTEDFVEQTSFVRLRNVTLSYTIPKNFWGSYNIPDMTLYFTGVNLWLSTDYKGIDPETSLMGAFNAQGIDYFNMPNTKSYVFGVNFNF